MNESYKLWETVDYLLDKINRKSIKSLLFEPIDKEDLNWYLARLKHQVAPSYLPFAADDIGVMAIHLWPGRSIELSPIVYISNDKQQAKFLCDQLSNFPRAFWLWIGQYFKSKPGQLRQALEIMTSSIPNAAPVPGEFWLLLENEPEHMPEWWFADCEDHTERAWKLADVGHPFVGLPKINRRAKPQEAVTQLEPFVREHQEPELTSLLVAAQVKAGLQPNAQDVVMVLSAEAWREFDCLLGGRWRVRGEGMCAWDSTLRHLPNPIEFLKDTPFEILADRSNTYSGQDRQGPLTLGGISKAFRDKGNYEEALRQMRNATTLAFFTLSKYPDELAMASAEICDAIEKNSLAADVARQSVQIDMSVV